MKSYDRKNTLINRKFYQYLMPTVLSTVAISLNEFVDSIIVSNLLGSKAMSMVNLGLPVMMVFAVIYTLLGVGGSVVYSKLAGSQDEERAKRFFMLTFFISVVVSAVVLVAGLAFLKEFAGMLCKEKSLLSQFIPYLRMLFISTILIIPLQVLITFFPSFGTPAVGTAVNITANAVNLLMDYIYIRFFATGLMGAALATFTGYVCGLALVIILLIMKKIQIPFAGFGLSELKEIPSVLSNGVAPAMNQFGYCVKISFCNNLSMDLAGVNGVTVFALCMQVVSIVSVIICGIASAMTPIAASLEGQGDNRGISLLMRTVMKTQFISNLILVIIFEAFPQLILFIYAVDGEITDMATVGLRIFSIMFIFRGFIFVFIYYFQVISRKIYATVLSIIDGFAGLIPLCLIFSKYMGINGLWLAFPVLSFLMLLGVVIVNLFIARNSGGKYSGILLTENEDQVVPCCDLTIPLSMEDALINAERLQEFCRKNNLGKYLPNVVAMALEEMVAYTMEHKESSSLDMIDVLVKIKNEQVVMDVRSVGKPFDSTSADEEKFSSIQVLKNIAESVDFSYVLGMNQTRIRMAKAVNNKK